jgi:hypothetical protein
VLRSRRRDDWDGWTATPTHPASRPTTASTRRSPPPIVELRSLLPRSITLGVVDAGTHLPIEGFELTCTHRGTGASVTASYPARGGTRFGFRRRGDAGTARVRGA